MYSLEVLITVAIAMTVLGLVAGLFIAQRTAPSRHTQQQLEEQLNQMQQQQQDYQHEVSEHFEETAKLLNQLTHNYRDIHQHLAKGARKLAGDKVETPIKQLTDDSNQNDGDTAHSFDDIIPPLDYAPKKSSTVGMLNEEFGLERNPRDNDDKNRKAG